MNFCHSSIFRQNISMKLTVGMCENVFSLLSLLFPLLFFMCSHAFAFSGGLLEEASSLFFSCYLIPKAFFCPWNEVFFPSTQEDFRGGNFEIVFFFGGENFSRGTQQPNISPPSTRRQGREKKVQKLFLVFFVREERGSGQVEHTAASQKKKLANDAEKLGKEEQAGSAARNWVAGKGWFHKFVVLKFPTKFENYWRRYLLSEWIKVK